MLWSTTFSLLLLLARPEFRPMLDTVADAVAESGSAAKRASVAVAVAVAVNGSGRQTEATASADASGAEAGNSDTRPAETGGRPVEGTPLPQRTAAVALQSANDQSANDKSANDSVPSGLQPPRFPQLPDLAGKLQSMNDVRQAAASLQSFGEAAMSISADTAAAAEAVSENMARMSAAFDPFGFKTAFETIRQQNATIEKQHRQIQKLQRQQIRLLQQLNGYRPTVDREPERPAEPRTRSRRESGAAGNTRRNPSPN